MNIKITLLIILCFCLSSSLFSHITRAVSDSDYSGRSTDNFYLQFPEGNSLIFQPSTTNLGVYVAIEPINGSLYGQNCYMWFGDNIGGKLYFQATSNCIVLVTFDNEHISTVKFDGNVVYPEGSTFPVYIGQAYELEWSLSLAPALPIMLVIGIIGLISLIIGPLLLINKLKARDMKGVVTGIAVTAIGFGLTIAWLWA